MKMKKSLSLTFIICIVSISYGQSVIGKWSGTLDIQGQKLAIAFNVEENGDALIATLDSPDQGAFGIPTDTCIFDAHQLKITAKQLQLTFEGRLTKDGDKINGNFNQGPMSFPLVLIKTEDGAFENRRPQEPTTIEYIEEEVTFKNLTENHTLSGTLTIPKTGQYNHVVVLISGSGPQDRNSFIPLFNHKPFLVLSDYLTRNAIAVLRYDDRGVGKSTGDRAPATSADYAGDASSAVAYLKGRKDMNGMLIGLIGHSEGGLIAPMVANSNKDVSFIVLLAGPGIPIPELLSLQGRMIAEADSIPQADILANEDLTSACYQYIIENPKLSPDKLKSGVHKIFKKKIRKFPESFKNKLGDIDNFTTNQVNTLTSPWMTYFIRFNPFDHLSKVTCPVLAINGSLDLQVSSKENLEGIRKALEFGGNENFKIKEMSGQNHLFQTATTGSPSEYKTIDETFNEGTMTLVADWIRSQRH